MPVITAWPTILAVSEGRMVEQASWDPIFDRFEENGQQPFRGDTVQPGWSAARFNPLFRKSENVVAMTAMVLDYDDCGTTFDEAVEMWGIFYGLIHTTRRHELEGSRFRVILPLTREISTDEYALLWRYVVRTSGHRVDQSTKDPSRFWYVPGPLNGARFRAVRLTGAMFSPDPMLVEAVVEEASEKPPAVTRIHPSAESRADRYAQGALDDACNAVDLEGPGNRNNRLYVAACTAGNFIAAGNLSEAYALERLETSARACGLPTFETRKTIRSGIAHGMKSPRPIPEPTVPPSSEPSTGARRAASGASPTSAESAGSGSSTTDGGKQHRDDTALHPLHGLWKSVGEWGLLDVPPPPQEWILIRPDVETNGMGNPIGLLPRSEVGFLIAAGGVGKSFALIQLALSVATGRQWLDYFSVPTPGHVLILLGEEKLKQAHRRFHDLATCMRLTDDQVRLVKANVVLMPLGGVIAPLVRQDGTDTFETDVMGFLRARMAEAEWMLVIIDPLSRFAGADTEKDNAQATRFVQIAESLCNVPGSPTVLFAHHTNKSSRSDDAPRPSAADARGASGTTDGGRWCANLTRRHSGASLTFTKNNYGQDFDETLVLERAYGGYLRVQSDEARQRAQQAEQAKHDAKMAEVIGKVREALQREPGLSKNDLRKRTEVRDAEVRTAVDHMEREGEVFQQPKNHYHLRSKSDD
jgi:RecA-family ATPase